MAKRKPRKKPSSSPVALKEPAPKPAEMPRVQGELTKCPKCESTERTRYRKTREPLIWHGGRTTWNRTQCKKCGQFRIDKHTHSV